MHIEFNKYKRVFAFGCSFTQYIYPTWADILASEMPNAMYYNFGNCGGGNLFITARLTEACRRFNFCETDLVMVMYSTSFREDRHINGSWHGPGNIFSQHLYPMETFVLPFCEPTGMLIRDLAMIDVSASFIRSLPCDNLLLKAAPIEEDANKLTFYNDYYNDALALYKPLLDSFPPSMRETEFPYGWESEITYTGTDGKMVIEMHPTPQRYYNYLVKLGINLTEHSKNYVDEANIKLNRCKSAVPDFANEFTDCNDRVDQCRLIMF